MMYDPVTDSFTTFNPVKAEPVTVSFFDDKIDVSNLFSRVNEFGIPIAKSNINKPETTQQMPDEFQGYAPEISEVEMPVQTSVTNPSDKANYALNFFINKGLKKHEAAGIVGNLLTESGLNTKAQGDFNKKSKQYTAYGIAQWRLDRLDNLKKFAKNRGTDISDLNTQLEFLWHELNTDYSKALSSLRNSTNVNDAVSSIMVHYERPNMKYANFSKRLRDAMNIYNG